MTYKFFKVRDPALTIDALAMECKIKCVNYKCGVLLVKAGQCAAADMLANDEATPVRRAARPPPHC